MILLPALAGCFPQFTAPRPSPLSTADTSTPTPPGDTAIPPETLPLPDTIEGGAVAAWIGERPETWVGDRVVPLGAIGGPAPDLLIGAKGASSVFLVIDAAVGPAPATPESVADAVRITWSHGPGSALGSDVVALVDDRGESHGIALGAKNAYDGLGAVWILGETPTESVDLALAPGVERWDGPGSDAHAGHALDSADLNHDGEPDLVVGSLGSADGSAAWLLLGPFGDGGERSLYADAKVALRSGDPGDQSGCAVGVLGHLDGTGELAVGVGRCLSYSAAGAVSLVEVTPELLRGPDHLLGQGDGSISGDGFGDRLGVTLRAAGDLDGDGYDDFLVGAHSCGYDLPPTNNDDCSGLNAESRFGRARWYAIPGGFGVPVGIQVHAVAGLTLESDEDHSSCNGAAVGRFVGDPDGVDLAIGRCGANTDDVVVLADPPLDGQVVDVDRDPVPRIPAADLAELAGADLSVADGYLAVGAWQAGPSHEHEGAVYLLDLASTGP